MSLSFALVLNRDVCIIPVLVSVALCRLNSETVLKKRLLPASEIRKFIVRVSTTHANRTHSHADLRGNARQSNSMVFQPKSYYGIGA